MANRWIEWVKSWASKKGISYSCALSQPECKIEYRKKFGVAKPLSRKDEIKSMAAEDKKVQKPKKKIVVLEEDFEDLTPDFV